jgi:hypothetical protein
MGNCLHAYGRGISSCCMQTKQEVISDAGSSASEITGSQRFVQTHRKLTSSSLQNGMASVLHEMPIS